MFLIPSALLHTVKSDEKKDLGQGQDRLVQFGCHIGSGGVRFPFSGSDQATMILQGQRENEQDVKPLQRHQLQSDNRHSPRCLSLIPVGLASLLCQSSFPPLAYFLGACNPAPAYSRPSGHFYNMCSANAVVCFYLHNNSQ